MIPGLEFLHRSIGLGLGLVMAVMSCAPTTPRPNTASAVDSGGAGDTTVVRGTQAERIDAYLSRATRFGFAGTMVVADSTGVLLHKGYGLADESKNIPNS